MKKIFTLLFVAIFGISFAVIYSASAADSAPQLIRVDVESTTFADGQPNPIQKSLYFTFNGPVTSPSLTIYSGLSGQSTTLSVISDTGSSFHSITGELTANDLVKFDLTVTVPGTQTAKSYAGTFATASSSQNNFISGHTLIIYPSDPSQPNLSPSMDLLFRVKSAISGVSIDATQQPSNYHFGLNFGAVAAGSQSSNGFGPIEESGSYTFRVSASDAASASALYVYYAGITPVSITPKPDNLTASLSTTDSTSTMTITATQPLIQPITMDMFFSNGMGNFSQASTISPDQKTLTINLSSPLKNLTYWLTAFAPNGYFNVKKGSFEEVIQPAPAPAPIPAPAPATASDIQIQKITQTTSVGSTDGVPDPIVRFSVQTNVNSASEKMSLWIEGQSQSTAITKDPSGNGSYTDDSGMTVYFKYFSFEDLVPDTIYRYSVVVHDETLTKTASATDFFRTIPAGSTTGAELDSWLNDTLAGMRPEYVTIAENDLDALRISNEATKLDFKECMMATLQDQLKDIMEFLAEAEGVNYEDYSETGHFICRGFDEKTKALGSGERHAVIRDYLNALGFSKFYWDDIQRISSGIKPIHRNLSKEQANVTIALSYFKNIFGHDPVFTNSTEDLAWNTLMYRIRFSRNLTLEAAGITKFRQIFFRSPVSPSDWSAVRILGYVKK